MPVKIIELEAENVKRIKAVQLLPAPNGLTVIGGNNNQGKTSVLDAIAWALGGEKFRPEAAQRDGANTPPHLRVQLSNGLVVERRGKNSALTVTDPSGRKGGQQLLNEFVEQLALDLPRFMNATDREKADILLRIIGVGDRLAALDTKIKALYDRRTAIGQIAESKKHHAQEMPEHHGVPDEPVNASELIRQQQEILARNAENQRKRERLSEIVREKENAAQSLHMVIEKLDELTARRNSLQLRLTQLEQDELTARRSAEALQDESTAELERNLREIETINARVRENLDRARALDEAAAFTAQYAELTAQIETERENRLNLLQGANLPLPGLSVEDGALTFEGRRWADMSGSDQLRVATAIVRKLNPDCGFVLLDKLEQMDTETLRAFGSWLEAEGLQAIATRVSTGGECRIIIEDGRAVGAGEEPAQHPKQWKEGVF